MPGVNAVPFSPAFRLDWLVDGATPLLPTPGRVALSSCPGRPDLGSTVRDDIEHLVRQQIGVVVSLVDDREMEFYGAYGVRAGVREAGLRSLYFPFVDTQPPEDLFATRSLCRQILSWLGEGEHVLLHCIGGWGRSGTLAASLLTHQGFAAARAIALVRAARSPRCVESRAQERFVMQYADTQADFVRYGHVAERAALPDLVTGPAGSRRLRRVARTALLQTPLLPAPPLTPSQVLLSGELLREASEPGEVPVDRAYVLRSGQLTPAPLRELLR
jgi:protein-tyrosine phosphatase